MVRDGNWKYTFWVHDLEELYNLEADPEELHNLAAEAQFVQEKQRLKSKLFHWYTPPDAAPKPAKTS
jgi:choline-sulfatase